MIPDETQAKCMHLSPLFTLKPQKCHYSRIQIDIHTLHKNYIWGHTQTGPFDQTVHLLEPLLLYLVETDGGCSNCGQVQFTE